MRFFRNLPRVTRRVSSRIVSFGGGGFAVSLAEVVASTCIGSGSVGGDWVLVSDAVFAFWMVFEAVELAFCVFNGAEVAFWVFVAVGLALRELGPAGLVLAAFEGEELALWRLEDDELALVMFNDFARGTSDT